MAHAFLPGSQRQISTVNTTGSVPTVFFPETRYRVELIRPALLFRPRLMIFSYYSRRKRCSYSPISIDRSIHPSIHLYALASFNVFRFDECNYISYIQVSPNRKEERREYILLPAGYFTSRVTNRKIKKSGKNI